MQLIVLLGCVSLFVQTWAQNASEVFLPAKDTHSAKRAADVAASKANFPVVERFALANGERVMIGPSLSTSTPAAAKFVQNQIQEFAAKAIPVGRVTATVGTAVLQAFQQNATDAGPLLKLETLGDFGALYEYIANTTAAQGAQQLTVPHLLKDWQTDASFGEDHLTYLSQVLQSIEAVPPDFGLTDDIIATITGSTEPPSALFIEDLHYVVELIDRNTTAGSTSKYTPGCVALFYVDAVTDSLLPLAIKLIDVDNTTLVYTPLDSAERWTLAKIAVGAAEVFYMQMGYHFYDCHVAQAGIAVQAMRHLSVRHPLRALLDHHYTEVFGIIAIGNATLLQPGADFDKAAGFGAAGGSRMLARRAQQWDFAGSGLKASLAARGLDKLPSCQYCDDAVALYNGIYAFVRQYLHLHYGRGPASLAAVAADFELQNWAAAVNSMGAFSSSGAGAGFASFPQRFSAVSALAAAVANIVFAVAVEHHAVNSRSLWHAYPLPARPAGLWYPLPKSKDEPLRPLREYLAPDEIIAVELGARANFYRPAAPGASLSDSYSATLMPALAGNVSAAAAVEVFEQRMGKAAARIASREKGSTRPFTVLSPDELAYYAVI